MHYTTNVQTWGCS